MVEHSGDVKTGACLLPRQPSVLSKFREVRDLSACGGGGSEGRGREGGGRE